MFPLPPLRGPSSIVISAHDGSPLRVFPDLQGEWHHVLTLSDVSPLYVQALLTYEDRWYDRHPGVNPFSLLRAAWQWIRHRQPVSGGSTLTMQVARILVPHPRTVWGKVGQIVRALQLEWHHTKSEILTCYLNRAPFGGLLVGVQAASYAYLGKSPQRLSHAEAALLAVLPQAPTRLRPDRNPEGAQRARDKVLRRLAWFGVWSEQQVREAQRERVAQHLFSHPLSAPLLARRLKKEAERRGGEVRTTIDPNLQRALESFVDNRRHTLPFHSSLAILLVENRSLAVRAYLGSADFLDNDRYGHVDMIQAVRSPGSTLKPFLYGMALDDGLIHSESLLADVPSSFGGYRPDNFSGGFHGPVSVREALQRSLNIPAVEVLDRLGQSRWVAGLRQGGLPLVLPGQEKPSLAIVLGGAGVTLERLTAAYTALARGGLAGTVRLTVDAPLRERRMLSAGAAWIVRRLLQTADRPDIPSRFLQRAAARRLAWKTGTSYGFRDAWAMGVTDHYTLGVWVGRPDGTPSPGQFGAATAAPILFDMIDGWPDSFWWGESASQPTSVQAVEICWPLGSLASFQEPHHCHVKRVAWALNETVPPTFPDRDRPSGTGGVVHYWINPTTSRRVDDRCAVPARQRASLALWPLRLKPWLTDQIFFQTMLPEPDPSCPQPPESPLQALRIIGLHDGTSVRSPHRASPLPPIRLSVIGGEGIVYWLVEGKPVAQSLADTPFFLILTRSGWHRITAIDEAGHHDHIRVHVE